MHLKVYSTVNRDGDNVATSVLYEVKVYSQVTEGVVSLVVDEQGTTQDVAAAVYAEKDVINSRSYEYIIPVEDRTAAYHGSSHPHNHEMELEYQAKFLKWQEDFMNSSAYTDILEEIWQ